MIAASNKLDNDLLAAEMAGRILIENLYDVKHLAHEDRPFEVSEGFRNFISKFHIQVKANEKMTVKSIGGKTVVIGD
jgi:hypothetical protein